MQSVIAKLKGYTRDGLNNTQGELGRLLSLSPLSVKLDEDPTPLESDEIVVLRSAQLRQEDVGKRSPCFSAQTISTFCSGWWSDVSTVARHGREHAPERGGCADSLDVPIRLGDQAVEARPGWQVCAHEDVRGVFAGNGAKILHTRRFRYAIYSERYGVDFLADKGRMRSGMSLSVIKAQAEEALEAHSEIERAQVQDIRFEGDRVVLHLEIEGVRGTTRMEVDAWKR